MKSVIFPTFLLRTPKFHCFLRGSRHRARFQERPCHVISRGRLEPGIFLTFSLRTPKTHCLGRDRRRPAWFGERPCPVLSRDRPKPVNFPTYLLRTPKFCDSCAPIILHAAPVCIGGKFSKAPTGEIPPSSIRPTLLPSGGNIFLRVGARHAAYHPPSSILHFPPERRSDPSAGTNSLRIGARHAARQARRARDNASLHFI